MLFHNVRSLHLHFDDVVSDYNVQASNINIFAETRLCSADHHTSYEMADFTLFRNDFNTSTSVRSSYGMAVYIKSNTAISKMVVGKMCTRQSRKLIWDMINTLFLTTVAVKPTSFVFH